jgi:ribosomal protein L40E
MSKEKICKECQSLYSTRGYTCQPCYQRQYHLKNKERVKERKQKYYLLNKAEIDIKSKDYSVKNKTKVLSKNRVHYQKNKKHILAYQKKIRNTPKRKYSQAIKSAKNRGLCWSIDYTDYIKIIAKPCHYCNQTLEHFGGSSLDRINNGKDYELTNVLPCCGPCNNIRNNFLSVKEMEVAMAAVVKLRKGEQNGT